MYFFNKILEKALWLMFKILMAYTKISLINSEASRIMGNGLVKISEIEVEKFIFE